MCRNLLANSETVSNIISQIFHERCQYKISLRYTLQNEKHVKTKNFIDLLIILTAKAAKNIADMNRYLQQDSCVHQLATGMGMS